MSGPLSIGRAVLAPMAGVTDSAFRRVCREFGAAAVTTEMISAKAVVYGDKKSLALADLSLDDGPVVLQLFGSEPETLALAAERLLAHCGEKAAGIDLNMGCPVPKIAGNGAGSALMKDPALCGAIVAAVKARVAVPVTVKLRAGWDRDRINAAEAALRCVEAGADGVCVHGRTRDQMYQGRADWSVIRAVKEAVPMPVTGNGDVTGPESAARMLTETGCDRVMVGRGTLGNPWVFRAINAYLGDSCTILPPPGIAERIVVIRRHIGMACDEKGEARAMREARKHVGWYLHGLRGAADFRRQAGELCTLEDLDRLLEAVYRANRDAPGEA